MTIEMASMREFYATWENWLFAVAVLVCLFFFLLTAKELWGEHRRPTTGKPMFPEMVFYYGTVYHRHDSMVMDRHPRYLTYYGVAIMMMGIVEWIVEGSVGLLVKLEIWGLAGAFLGEVFFSFIGACMGIPATWLSLKFNPTASVASTALIYVIALGRLGSFLGLLAGMAFFYYVIALLNELTFWVVAAAASIPTLIIFVELVYKTQKGRKANVFVNKITTTESVTVTGSAHYCVEENPFPEVVVSRDPNELSKRRVVKANQ